MQIKLRLFLNFNITSKKRMSSMMLEKLMEKLLCSKTAPFIVLNIIIKLPTFIFLLYYYYNLFN